MRPAARTSLAEGSLHRRCRLHGCCPFVSMPHLGQPPERHRGNSRNRKIASVNETCYRSIRSRTYTLIDCVTLLSSVLTAFRGLKWHRKGETLYPTGTCMLHSMHGETLAKAQYLSSDILEIASRRTPRHKSRSPPTCSREDQGPRDFLVIRCLSQH
jgi:hypothetical protein